MVSDGPGSPTSLEERLSVQHCILHQPQRARRAMALLGCSMTSALRATIGGVACRGHFVSRFIDEADRSQGTLLPATIDEYVCEENPVRVIDAFVGALDLAALGFEDVEPEATGRPAYHPATMLKIYLYGYLNRIQSTRRLEQEARRNLELMWLVGRLAPDFKTLADFRADGNTRPCSTRTT